MPRWLSNFVMLTGLGVWAVVIVAHLWQGKLPDAAILGVPGLLVLALYPPKFGRGGDDPAPPAPPAVGGGGQP